MQRLHSFLLLSFVTCIVQAQDYYSQARASFDRNQVDSARLLINENLRRKPTAQDYFLSALIHDAQGKPLRAVSDYEATIQRDPGNMEAYFQKGMIYYNASSYTRAIDDFTHVINNIDRSPTRAIYFGNDPFGDKGTFMTTLQSMKGRVFQYRGLAYQEINEWEKAEKDFDYSIEHDSTADSFINRSMLYQRRGEDSRAISDLKQAIRLDPTNYLAWYNLALIDESTLLPEELLQDETFAPMMDLLGANAFESEEYDRSIQYYTKALEIDDADDLALIGRGKALLKTRSYGAARTDFLKALRLNPQRQESFFLIGNSFFYEQAFDEAIGFYEQYLSVDPAYENVWYNAAMSYLSIDDKEKGCAYLKKADDLGMDLAKEMLSEQCGNQ